MAVHELRRFNFFDLNADCDSGAVRSLIKDGQLTLATSGHGSFVLCDNEGSIHILNRNFKATSFRAYTINVALAEYVKHSPFLVTVGCDEAGVNHLLKVWNTDKLDKNGNPTCVRTTRLNLGQKTVQPTCLSVQEGSSLLAVGFEDGSILLFRGDVTRDRSSKPKLLKDSGTNKITGLAFRMSNKYSFLFAASTNHIFFYDVSAKDKEIKIELDNVGCQPGCSIMAESPHGANFVVGRSDAIYCYTTDGKGPCYAVEGEKVLIQWSKMYLVIVSKDETKASSSMKSTFTSVSEPNTTLENHSITIMDIQNKLIVFSTTMKPVLSVLVEWGSFYIVTKDLKIHHLAEKNVQSKLPLLFKKNLYDVAIRMAKSQHYDEEGLADIFRQYGDHLYAKGDRFGAIEQYIKTIGKLEPSYIIRKFMESTHMEQLMEYLQALHRAGLADGDHTTLLLNCYTKLGRTTDLKNFIMTKDRELDFDIDIALKVVRGVNPEDALQLAKAHGKHLWVLRILLEDQKKYREAISYLRTLETSDAEQCLFNFGDILINKAPEDTTDFLKDFCVSVKNQEGSIPLNPMGAQRKARPQDFLHLFLNKSEYLVTFLEHLIQNQTSWSTQIYNALVEHYLVVWSRAGEGHRYQVEQRLMKLLQNPDALFDKNQTFILCQTYNFSPGIILLYEENKMYHQVLQYHMTQGNYKDVLATCKRYGSQDPYLWIQALWSIARQPEAPAHLLSDILAVIDRPFFQSPSHIPGIEP
ncbi:UNVERIFIED_CONTAM: hypothetical protein PYX00_003181 [Menopon gallinae]|uniref:PEP5/VPS11 N-terminal domain-containing protein n=1 Tax=Menopon gallinae TaxID=328185 RepID=A0AAW2HZ03_9NEOP